MSHAYPTSAIRQRPDHRLTIIGWAVAFNILLTSICLGYVCLMEYRRQQAIDSFKQIGEKLKSQRIVKTEKPAPLKTQKSR